MYVQFLGFFFNPRINQICSDEERYEGLDFKLEEKMQIVAGEYNYDGDSDEEEESYPFFPLRLPRFLPLPLTLP